MAKLNKRCKVNHKVTNNKTKKGLFGNALLLKQTLFATWKSKLQLVILLLLTAFATSLVTGSWISYVRMITESNQLGLNDLKFDAVLPYSPVPQGIKQIANQAFSLKLGRFYIQDGKDNKSNKTLYFDDTRIGHGQEIMPITKENLIIDYIHDSTGAITGFNSIKWKNAKDPLVFNLKNNNVKASIYGQLLLKSSNATNRNLKQHFKDAADHLYRDIFLKITAPNILTSITTFIKEWIASSLTNPILKDADSDKVTTWILDNKVNFRAATNDATIPDSVNLQEQKARDDLFTKLVKKTDPDPRLNNDYGMNGQWMRIYRNFAETEKDSNIYTNFTNSYIGYVSPFNYNMISDGSEQNAFSLYLVRAVAALQMRDLYVRNQFTASAGVVNNVQINTKIIDIGLVNGLNHTNLKVFEGLAPSSKNEVVITPQYARKNNSHKAYRPSDHIEINGTDFIISGIGGDAYDIYPTISDLDPIPNTRTEFIAYVTPSAWNDSNWYKAADKTDITLMYFTPWNDVRKDSIPEFDTNLFNDFFQKTIFSDNGKSDLSQDDYNKYLVNKYNGISPVPPSTYIINLNPVITSSNSQFSIYNSKEKIFTWSVTSFLYVALAGVIFLLAVVIFVTTLIVKKAIQHGQVSMGILKSIGYKTWQITISYLAYPILTLLIAIPIGWIAGLAIQVYLTEIFNTLFVLPYNVFNFDVVPLFISIVLIIGFITIVILLTAFRLLKQDPLFLIKKDSDLALGAPKGKGSKFLQNNFRFRLLLSLSKTSWKKILVTTGVITLASLSIVATTLVPATINSLKINYFKTQRYKNYYEYQTPMPNMPMSKYGLYAWNFFDRPSNEKYYPSYGAMPWPEDKIIYDQTTDSPVGWYNPLLFKKTQVTNNFPDIFTFDSSFPDVKKKDFLNKMSHFYQQKETGTLELNDLIWSYSWLGGKAFSNQLITDLRKADNTSGKIFSYNIINFASGQLPTILQVPNPGVPSGPEAIKEILKQVLPGFVRQSIDSLPKNNPNEDPYDYFTIGHNTIAFNPKSINNGDINGPDEELVTQFKVGVEDSPIAKKGLMDIIGINPHTVMLVLKNDEVNALKYNDSATTIPMVVNRAFQSKFGLRVGSQFSGVPQVNTLCYKDINGKSIPLPKENWYYGKTPPPATDSTNGNIWSKNSTKWNYRGDREIELAYALGDDKYSDRHGTRYNGMYDSNGQPIINDDPNTWNNVNDIWLKLPDDISPNSKKGKIPTADNEKTIDFDLSHILDLTRKWIRPFSYDLIKADSGFDPNNPLSILLSRPAEWFMGMVNNNILTKENNINVDSLEADIKNNMPTWWQNITGDRNPVHEYQVVGIQDSYDAPKAYIDQKWANKIMGYSYINDKPYYSGTDMLQWFNGKLSANANMFDLIGRMSFKSSLDDYTMYATTNLSGNQNLPMIKNNYLLLRQEAMLTKMSDIAFSASALFIVTTVICSILIVIMITDLFTDQFRRFMAHMKAEGYTNWEINSFTLGIFTPWALLGYFVGFALGYLAIFGLIIILTNFVGVALPFTITWWILPVSFIIIGGIYISTFIINNNELNKMNLIELLKSDE